MKAGDVILAFGGQKVSSMKSLPRLVARAKIGQPAIVDILRQGEQKTLKIVVGRMKEGADFARLQTPDPNSKAKGPNTVLGLGLSTLTASVRTQLGLSEAMKGIVVTSVDATSVAAEKNIQIGDVITEMQQDTITTPEGAAAKVAQLKKTGAKSILVLVENPKGDTRYVALPIE